MLGDNRDDSIDSRYYGPVPLANVRGSPMLVYYSYDTEDGLDYFRALTEIRWGRIGHWVR
jgi:signal peptidase I